METRIMGSQRNFLCTIRYGSSTVFFWIIIGGATCLLVFMSLGLLSRKDESPRSTSPILSPSPNATSVNQGTTVAQDLPVPPSTLLALKDEEKSAIPPDAPYAVPQPDEAIHRKIVAGFNAKLREATRGLYGGVFQQLHLSADLQEKAIDILTQQEKQLEQQAFEAARSGNLPSPPSSETVRAQQLQQDQQLRSVLGDAGFAEFNQYRATIPDRMIINEMNQQGANLSESQSQQLLQVLGEERQQIIGQAGITRNLDSMSPDQATTVIQQQQALLQQAVGNRVQSLLTPEQATTLQGVFSRLSNGPKPR